MEINIKKPKRKASRKGIRTKARVSVLASTKQKNIKHKAICTDLTTSNKSLTPLHQHPSKPAIHNQKSIEKTDDIIGRLSSEKEERLLNLIVKTIVRTTLDQLYGKESN